MFIFSGPIVTLSIAWCFEILLQDYGMQQWFDPQWGRISLPMYGIDANPSS